MTGYCMKCKALSEMAEGEDAKVGKSAAKVGKCSKCGTKITAMVPKTEATGRQITIGYLERLLRENNEKYGTTFEIAQSYGLYELWADGNRIEAGSKKDIYNAFVRERFNEKWQTGAHKVEKESEMRQMRAVEQDEIPGVAETDDEITIDYKRYGPGKFSDNVEEFVYNTSLDGASEELGDAETFGYYVIIHFGKPVNVKQENAPWSFRSAIMTENSQGFIYVDYYDTEDEAKQAWAKLEAEYEDFLGETEEEDYDVEESVKHILRGKGVRAMLERG